jgi:protein TonB
MSIHAPRWSARSDSPSKVTLLEGQTAPQFQYSRFGSTFAENLLEWFKPAPRRIPGAKVSPLEVSWHEASQVFWRSQALAMALYICALLLLLIPLGHRNTGVTHPPVLETDLIAPDISEYVRKLPPGNDAAHGGGGGGKHILARVTSGRAPKFTSLQIAPPSLHQNENAKLLADASLLGSPELQFPSSIMNRYGDPLANLVNDSDGQGSGGGMGNGKGTGDGSGEGPGLGPGRYGGFGGDAFRPGLHGVGYPTCAYCPDAKYSEEARKAKYQGVVLLQVIISADGRATNIEVVRGPGLGLDEQAVAAVKTWRFKPALGPNRAPVPTRIAIEVQFRLL